MWEGVGGEGQDESGKQESSERSRVGRKNAQRELESVGEVGAERKWEERELRESLEFIIKRELRQQFFS